MYGDEEKTPKGRKMMGRNLIIGDIHSRYGKLMNVLKKACFNPDADILYSTGDLCDRGDKPVEVLDCLMGFGKSFCPVLGNHDSWLEYWLHTGTADPLWIERNGGDITVEKLSAKPAKWLEKLRKWIEEIPLLRITETDIIMHAGLPKGVNEEKLISIARTKRPTPIFMTEIEFMNLIRMGIDMREYETLEELYWDRDYLISAITSEYGDKDVMPPLRTSRNIWIGHSPMRSGKPFHSESYHLCAIDTGAGKDGPLTVMDMDTTEFWQA